MISHYELCKNTAQRFVKDAHVAVYEYQSFASGEFPDVLIYKDGACTLFEIKVTRSDFLADKKKYNRREYKPRVSLYLSTRYISERLEKEYLELKAENPELFYIEAPHLGSRRNYVCPHGMIEPDEVPEGWGLYWYRVTDGKFFHKKRSKRFKRNIYQELSILSHAFRKYASEGDDVNVLINKYGGHNANKSLPK